MDIQKQIVYLFRHKGTDFVKIGMTSTQDCSSRFQAFCTYSPWGAEIVGTIICDNARKLECKLHKEFSHKRINGEFFNLNQQECEGILNMYQKRDYSNIISIIKSNFHTEEDIIILERLIKSSIKSKRNPGDEEKIFKYIVESEKPQMTCADISKYLIESANLMFSPTKLGLILSKKYKSKRVKVHGSSKTLYFVKPVLNDSEGANPVPVLSRINTD